MLNNTYCFFSFSFRRTLIAVDISKKWGRKKVNWITAEGNDCFFSLSLMIRVCTLRVRCSARMCTYRSAMHFSRGLVRAGALIFVAVVHWPRLQIRRVRKKKMIFYFRCIHKDDPTPTRSHTNCSSTGHSAGFLTVSSQ